MLRKWLSLSPGHRLVTPALCLLLTLLSACSDPSGGGEAPGVEANVEANTDIGLLATAAQGPALIETLSEQQQIEVHELVNGYLQQAGTDFDSAQRALEALQSAVTTLLSMPDADTLEAARSAWLIAHSAYESTLLHRYFADLVLPQPVYLRLEELNYRLNQWPILPGYVDAVANYPDSGLVFDPSVAIDRATLLEIHGQFDLTEAALGFHVLEFLLWGENQDRDDLRQAADFEPTVSLSKEQADSGLTTEQLPNNRRRRLVQEVMASLTSDYAALSAMWNENIQDFRNRLEALPASPLLSALLQTVSGMLTEELLVRSLYPLLNGNYTDSLQSPFSHSTQNAVVAQIASIESLLFDVASRDGVRLGTLLNELSEDFAELFYQNFDANKECLVLLYSTASAPETPEAATASEFEIVECINLLSNMIDHFSRIDSQLAGP